MQRLLPAALALIACALPVAAARAAEPMDEQIRSSSFTTTDGVRLRVLESCPPGVDIRGSPVIVLIPGWLMPASIWRAQLAELGTARCIAALDPRGQGASEVPPEGYTIARRATDLREFVSRYGRVVLVGWSLGALEALEYVARHGHDAIDALVLVDSSVGEDPAPAAGTGFVESLRNDRRTAMADFVRGMFGAPRPEPEIVELTDAALRLPLEASLSLLPRELPREHWRGIVRAFPKPLLYVVSAQFADQARALQQHRPATQVAVFENAGHALFADEPARFNALIEQFVQQTAAGI